MTANTATIRATTSTSQSRLFTAIPPPIARMSKISTMIQSSDIQSSVLGTIGGPVSPGIIRPNPASRHGRLRSRCLLLLRLPLLDRRGDRGRPTGPAVDRQRAPDHLETITHGAEPHAVAESLVDGLEAPSVVADLDHQDIA